MSRLTPPDLAAAQGPPPPPDPPEPPSTRTAFQRLGCFGVLFGGFWPLVFTPFMVATLGPLIVPSIAQLAAPFACPAGYVRSTVKTWQTWQGDGDSSEHWELQCTDAAGAARPAPGTATWSTLFALTDAAVITGFGGVFGLIVVGGALRRRRRAPQSGSKS